MKRFFKNRFFIMLLCVAIVLTVVPSVLSFMGLGSVVRNAIGVCVAPARQFFLWVGNGIGGFAEYFTEFERVKEENSELRSRLELLEDQIYNASVRAEENEWLRAFLSLKRENEDFRFCDALIVGRESGNYMTVFTLDRGSAAGVEVNMPVVTDRGVVGYITEVGLTWSKAATLLEDSAAVGVYCERSGALGLAEGSYELREKALCRVNYLDPNADVKAGDRFVTSGIGSVYPRGLYVGEVVSVYPDNYGRGLIAEISPMVDLSSLSRVMIITDFAEEEHNTSHIEENGGAEG